MKKYDIGIIGAGPAGYTAALHARSEGLNVVMFEKDLIGGVCLNKGCIPTKAVMHAAELYEEMKSCEDVGIFVNSCAGSSTFGGISVDFEKVMAYKNQTVEKIRKSLELSLKNAGVTIVSAEAKLQCKNTISADGELYECGGIIAATGSKPRPLKGLEFDHEFILSSDDILNLKKLPKNIVIVGSGSIGTEWARIFAAFGVEVTVVEVADRLLPAADFEVSKRLERIFKAKNIKTVLSYNGDIRQDFKDAQIILAAVGRIPCEEKTEDGVVYLGDACGSIQLAHFAAKQAIEEIKGIKFDKSLVPSVVYGCPEIAWIGAREQDLEQGTYQKSGLLISALGKSHCDNCTDGFIKILSREGKILGAHIVSKEASALIHQILIAMQNNITTDKLKEVCFAHPTYSEGIFECLFR